MRTTLIAATTLAAATLPGQPGARAQPAGDASADPVIQEYRAKLPLLLERYSTNRKIRTRDVRYVTDPKTGGRVGDEVVHILGEVVTDGKQMKAYVLEGKMTNPALEQRKTDVNFWRPDMRFDVTRKGSGFKIVNQELASVNYYNHEEYKYQFCAHVPMSAGGSGDGTSLWFDERGRKAAVITVIEVKHVTRNGRPCVEVRTRWDNRHGMVETASTFLDPAHDYVTVATELDWKPDFFTKKEFRLSSEVEYAPSAEGFPLPKFLRVTNQHKGQEVRKVRDVEFLSYERYVPSADEFQLEGPYGLTTPAEVPAAANPAVAPPPGRRVWPWVAVAAGLALAAATGVLVYRSRRATRPTRDAVNRQ